VEGICRAVVEKLGGRLRDSEIGDGRERERELRVGPGDKHYCWHDNKNPTTK
jgi:hypothetical protein